MSASHWTDHITADLVKRWLAGESAAQIARLYTQTYGRPFTRNMVLSKAHRSVPCDQKRAKASKPGRPATPSKPLVRRDAFAAVNERAIEARRQRAELRRAAQAVVDNWRADVPPAVTSSIIQAAPKPFVRITHGGRATAMSKTGTDGNDAAIGPVAGVASVTMLDLKPGQCRMPIGGSSSTELLFCGCPCGPGRRGFEPWCSAHKIVAVDVRRSAAPRTVGEAIGRRRKSATAEDIGRRINGF